jgi:hypothetical protein
MVALGGVVSVVLDFAQFTNVKIDGSGEANCIRDLRNTRLLTISSSCPRFVFLGPESSGKLAAL